MSNLEEIIGKMKSAAMAAGVAIGVTGALLVVSLPWTGPHLDRDVYQNARVTDKTVKRNKTRDTYMIFTKLPDNSVRVFENVDSALEWKFNSSDVQGKIEVGKTYTIRTYGFRFTPLSWYENIIDVEDVKR